MSKKMMKRSLALGALMAFVITGSALAAGESNKEMTVSDSRTTGFRNSSTVLAEEAVLSENNVLNITTGANINITTGTSSITNTFVSAKASATAKNNSLNISGGTIKIECGICSANVSAQQDGNNATANDNKLTISGVDTIVEITGNNTLAASRASSAKNNAESNNNSLEIKDGAKVTTGWLYVGDARGEQAVANNNSLMVSDSAELSVSELSSIGHAMGSERAEASNNSIIIDGNAKVSGELYSAYAYANNGDENSSTVANGNTIKITDNATVGSIGAVHLYGYSRSEGKVESNNNVVMITGSAKVDTEEGVYGVYSDNGNNYTAGKNISSGTGNQVIISDNAMVKASKGVFGAYVTNSGIGENTSTVTGNSVTISGNAVIDGNTKVYGGYAESLAQKDIFDYEITESEDGNYTLTYITSVYGGTAENLSATATGNTVNITGDAVVKGEVYGGYASVFKGGGTQNTSASENTINVSGNANISGATLIGSMTETLDEKTETITGVMNEDGDLVGSEDDIETSTSGGNNVDTSATNTSDNTLNISKDWTGGEGGKKVETLGNFDEIVIEEMQYGEAALEVTNMNYKVANEEAGADGTKLTVKRMNVPGDQSLEDISGLQIINVTGESNLDNEEGSEEAKGSISDESSITIYKGTSQIIEVGFGESSLNEEGGIDIDENNVKQTTRNEQVLVIGESRAAATAFVNQGSEIVETGLDALARDNSKAGDTKVFAAVYGNASEYATGSHVKVNGWSGIVGIGKTNDNGLTVGAFFENGTGNYRTYNTVNNDFMRGDGEATYNGGGFLVRKDNKNGVYTEASLRAGNLQNELRNAVRGSEGLAGYDVDTFYYGAHVGVGKIISRGNEGDSIDVYGKFIYTHHDSEDFTIDGSDFHFDSVDSERLRIGFRINEVQTNKLSMYYGAAWEYEFNGDADNTTVGYDLATPSLGGSTMIGEIGMHYNASEKWSLDLNVRGYSGQRDGFTGSVQANYAF